MVILLEAGALMHDGNRLHCVHSDTEDETDESTSDVDQDDDDYDDEEELDKDDETNTSESHRNNSLQTDQPVQLITDSLTTWLNDKADSSKNDLNPLTHPEIEAENYYAHHKHTLLLIVKLFVCLFVFLFFFVRVSFSLESSFPSQSPSTLFLYSVYFVTQQSPSLFSY